MSNGPEGLKRGTHDQIAKVKWIMANKLLTTARPLNMSIMLVCGIY